MAFKATSVTLKRGYDGIKDLATQYKLTWLPSWNAQLAGNIDAFAALGWKANIDLNIPAMDAWAALPGMAAYAQAQENIPAYNVVVEYTAMKAALVAVRDWIVANIPANSITVTQGVQVAAVFAPAATAPLKALVIAAAASIE